MTSEPTPQRKTSSWWFVGLGALAAMLLCTCCALAAGIAAFSLSTDNVYRSDSYELAPVPAEPAPLADDELPLGPDFRAASGALILQVVPGSPAEAIGIQAGDVITAVNGRALTENWDPRAAFADLRPGDMVDITYWSRDTREERSVKVQLAANPNGGTAFLGVEYRMMP